MEYKDQISTCYVFKNQYFPLCNISTNLFNNLTLVGVEGDPNGVCVCTEICGVAGCEQALHELGQPKV